MKGATIAHMLASVMNASSLSEEQMRSLAHILPASIRSVSVASSDRCGRVAKQLAPPRLLNYAISFSAQADGLEMEPCSPRVVNSANKVERIANAMRGANA
jgi:hypothetical protein